MRRAVQALPDGVVILDARPHRVVQPHRRGAARSSTRRTDLGQTIANLVRIPEFIDYLESRERAAGAHRPRPRPSRSRCSSSPTASRRRLLLSRDVTQAERVDAMRRDFVANVSHELRTPLTVLVGLPRDPARAEARSAAPARLPRHDAGAGRAHAAHRRGPAHALGARLGAAAAGDERIAMRPLLERLRADAEALSGGRHAIRLQIEDAHSDLLGAENELASAFGNLVSNAIRYTPAGGTVTPGLARRPGRRALQRRGHRHRHRRRAHPAAHRALLPRRPQPLARDRRHRPGPRDRQARARAPRRHARDRERARQGQPLQRALSGAPPRFEGPEV